MHSRLPELVKGRNYDFDEFSRVPVKLQPRQQLALLPRAEPISTGRPGAVLLTTLAAMHLQTYRARSLPCGLVSACLQSRSVRPVKNLSARICNAPPALANRQRSCTCISAIAHQGSAALSTVDIDSSFDLQDASIDAYRRNGFVKIPAVFDEATLAHYGPSMSLEVAEADKTPLQQDPDYQQAFTQVVAILAHVA